MRKELLNLNKNGKINDYLYYQLFNRIDILPEKISRELIEEAQTLTAIGVETEDDHKHFAYIKMHLKTIAEDLSGKIDNEDLAKLSSIVYNNRNLYPIDTMENFYKAAGNALKILDIPIKKSYPVSMQTFYAKEERDVEKWLGKMREIYGLVHRGYSFNDALNAITANWDIMEKQDFTHWMKFYSAGDHLKYKTAQLGYAIPYEALKAKVPNMNQYGVDVGRADDVIIDEPSPQTLRANQFVEPDLDKKLRNQAIDKKMETLIGRLRAAERIATRPEVIVRLKEVLDMDVGDWLELLHKLTRKVELAPIKHVSSTILEDLIIREANILTKNGKVNAGRLLRSIAQDTMEDTTVSDPSQSPAKTESTPTPIGTPGDLGPGLPPANPAVMPPADSVMPPADAPMPSATPQAPLPAPAPEPKTDPAMNAFISRLNLEKPEDKGEADDSYADDMVVMAQEVMPVSPRPPIPVQPIKDHFPEPHIKVTEEPDIDSFDLGNVKVADVVKRLELVANVLKNREIPRQLAIVDLMLDKLGIASFFPTLAEATRSALESNQYMSTRIEDVLGKLRGSLEPSDKDKIDLVNDEEEEKLDRTLETIKHNLSEEDKKQKELKEKRKSLRDMGMQEPEKKVPEDMAKELSMPATIEKSPPPALRPLPPAPKPPAAPIR